MKTKDNYHHGDLRSALIDAARQLVLKNGPHAVSLREVAKIAGVSHAAPYRHFKDKEQLLASIAEIGFARLADCLEQIMATQQEPRLQITEAGKIYVRLALESPEIALLMFGSYQVIDCNDENLQRSSMRAYQRLVDIIENGLAARLYIERDSNDLALAVWSLVHGFSLLAIGKHVKQEQIDTPKKLDSLTHQLCEMLLSGILR